MRGTLQRDSNDPFAGCGKIIPCGSYHMRNDPRTDRKIESRTRKVAWLPIPYENRVYVRAHLTVARVLPCHRDYFCPHDHKRLFPSYVSFAFPFSSVKNILFLLIDLSLCEIVRCSLYLAKRFLLGNYDSRSNYWILTIQIERQKFKKS